MKRSLNIGFSDDDNECTGHHSNNKLSMKTYEKLICQYGKSCYRKNAKHFVEYLHPDGSVNMPKDYNDDNKSTSTSGSSISLSPSSISSTFLFTDAINPSKAIKTILMEDNKRNCFKPLIFLTKVSGIDDCYNEMTINITDILSEFLGTLIKSCQFNYCIDVEWVLNQYPPANRNKPLLIVHGSNQEERRRIEDDAKKFPNIKLCNAPLEISFGTHHTKMMFLLYEQGLRIVITTANLRIEDWHQKTQGVWVSPLFKKLSDESCNSISNESVNILGDSKTNFKSDLIQYLRFYKRHELNEWIESIKQYDMSSARVFLIASTPGRHSGPAKNIFGHLKMKEVLRKHNSCNKLTNKWPIIAQFSSVGSLGASSSVWLTGEFSNSLAAGKIAIPSSSTNNILKETPPLQLIFPSVENVRLSLEGYAAGGSIPYSFSTSKKQPYFNQYLHQWVASKSGRSLAAPHIKSYLRLSPSIDCIAWFLLTSSNLSKAAWGVLEKNSTQLMIRSYELGVLFIPNIFCDNWDSFDINNVESENYFSLPFDVPLTAYTKYDKPWIWDLNYTNQPDSCGNIYSRPGT